MREMKPVFLLCLMVSVSGVCAGARERNSLDAGWRFTKGDPTNSQVSLLYDVRRRQATRRFAAEADGNSALNQSAITNESTNVTAVIK